MTPLRLLDLGCHDGWIGAWLKEQLPDVELYGIEFNPDACAKARERGYVKVVKGAAEDAPETFEPGTFDAVACFELLEHVPDMDRLLDALEQMLKPGGRIYCSTPDGTFGSGSNPHHLRALRSIDLAEILRRRGRIHDATVGIDGVSVASYSPAERLGEIAIYCGPCWDSWSPVDIELKGLGGSETAAVRLSEQLSQLGYVVTVYGELQDQCCYDDVVFRHHSAFDPLERRHAVISSRMPALFDRPVAARVRLLWAHDTDFGPGLTAERAARIDHVLVLSEWHRRHVAGLYPFVKPKLRQIRNGIEHSYFNGAGPAPTREQRVLYTSSPDRGLDVLLELWPQVRERVPDATLEYAYSPVYWRVAEQDPVVGAHAAKVAELSKQDGVRSLGHLSQPELATLMRSSTVWAHPSWATPHNIPFHETSCIGAMEAQAAGCRVVASNWGALPETVRVGALVDGEAPGERWRAALVEEIVRGLTDEQVQEHAQAEGPKAVAKLGWAGVARQVAKLVEGEA